MQISTATISKEFKEARERVKGGVDDDGGAPARLIASLLDTALADMEANILKAAIEENEEKQDED